MFLLQCIIQISRTGMNAHVKRDPSSCLPLLPTNTTGLMTFSIMLAQWLALLPCEEGALGSSLCGVSVFSPVLAWVSSGCSGFLLESKTCSPGTSGENEPPWRLLQKCY